MTYSSLDKLHSERVKVIAKKAFDTRDLDVSELFISERASKTIHSQKVLQLHFRTFEILGTAPFTENLYATLCPICVRPESADDIRELAGSGLVIPVLSAPYQFYHETILQVLAQVEHISYHEYSFYRYFRLMTNAKEVMCQHCLGKANKRIKTTVRDYSNRDRYLGLVGKIETNLFPHIYPDAELIDQASVACKGHKIGTLTQLENLSRCMRNIRSAEAFSAAVEVDLDVLKLLPKHSLTEGSSSLRTISELRKFAASGLGLRIPEGVRLAEYIEILKDYRPRILEVVDGVVFGNCASKTQVSLDKLAKRIHQVNREIERIKGLKRYAFWEACVAFLKSNGAVAATALTASSLVGAGHLLGCVTLAGSAASLGFAKKKGWVQENAPAKRLGKMIVRDAFPHLNRLIGLYLGAGIPAINVLSLRRKLERRARKSA